MDPNQEFQPPPPPAIQSEPERRRPSNLMFAGIGLVVIGVVVVVLGLPMINLIVGGIGTGLALCALGVLFFAFSFMRLPAIENAPSKMSPVATLTGIFFEPSNVFRNLRAHPQFLAAILIAGAMSGAYSVAFTHRLTPERIINFTMDKLEDSPIKPPPEAMAKARTEGVAQAKAITFQIGDFIKKVVSAFFGVAFVAGLALLGVAAGALVGGIVTAVLSGQASDSINAAAKAGNPFDPSKESAGKTDTIVSGVMFGVAGAATVAGGVLLVLGIREGHAHERRVSLLPTLSPTSVGASATVRFQ